MNLCIYNVEIIIYYKNAFFSNIFSDETLSLL